MTEKAKLWRVDERYELKTHEGLNVLYRIDRTAESAGHELFVSRNENHGVEMVATKSAFLHERCSVLDGRIVAEGTNTMAGQYGQLTLVIDGHRHGFHPRTAPWEAPRKHAMVDGQELRVSDVFIDGVRVTDELSDAPPDLDWSSSKDPQAIRGRPKLAAQVDEFAHYGGAVEGNVAPKLVPLHDVGMENNPAELERVNRLVEAMKRADAEPDKWQAYDHMIERCTCLDAPEVSPDPCPVHRPTTEEVERWLKAPEVPLTEEALARREKKIAELRERFRERLKGPKIDPRARLILDALTDQHRKAAEQLQRIDESIKDGSATDFMHEIRPSVQMERDAMKEALDAAQALFGR